MEKNWQKKIVEDSRRTDIAASRSFAQSDYIDVDFLTKELALQKSRCIYCQMKMLFGEGQRRNAPYGLTVQRIDANITIAHTRANSVLAC